MSQLRMNTYAIGDHIRIYSHCSWTKTTDKTSWYDAIVDEIEWWWELYSGAHIYARVTAVVIGGRNIPHSGSIGKRTDFFAREDQHVFRPTPLGADLAITPDEAGQERAAGLLKPGS